MLLHLYTVTDVGVITDSKIADLYNRWISRRLENYIGYFVKLLNLFDHINIACLNLKLTIYLIKSVYSRGL